MMEYQWKTKSDAEIAIFSILDQANAGMLTTNGDLCNDLLTCLSTHHDLQSKVAEVFALLAKKVAFRDTANEHDVLFSIVPLLSSVVIDTRLQAMRAIGNLCIDHDFNREVVLSSGGCALLIHQLSRCLDGTAEDGKSDRMKCITCGCILNVANSNEKLSKELLSLDVLSGLAQLVSIVNQDKNVIQMAMQALTVLLDYAEIESLLTSPLSRALPNVLQQCVEWEQDFLEVTLEVIGILVENDKWKICLVESGCINLLCDIKTSNLIRKVMDIIILIVTEDKCLDLLCNENKVLSKTIEWISAADLSLEAKASAALIVANIARNDANCLLLVEKGIVPLLIALTRLEEPKELFGKLHHSALCALRNLSIPSQNKRLFLQLGVVDVGLSLLKQSTQAHVQLKALGLLRLLVEKQAVTCCRIISEDGLIGRVCDVCAGVGPIHIQSEGSRLLATLVKYCESPELMTKIATDGGIKWICVLLESEHVLMINDGLIALCLLAATKNDVVYDVMMKTADLPKLISSIITSPNTSVEILSNVLTLIEKLCTSDGIRSQLSVSMDLRKSLQQLHSCDYSNDIKQLLEELSQVLKIKDIV